MGERSEEEQPQKPKTYSFEITLIKRSKNYTMSSLYSQPSPFSPATTTRSNRGFQLSPRVRVSKMVMQVFTFAGKISKAQ
jgi:hypothetical protein